MQVMGCKSQAMFVQYFAQAKSYFIVLCVLLLSPKQLIAAGISSSDVPVANLPPLQSKAGIMVQANYTEFGLERGSRSCTKLSFQFFPLWGSSLLVCEHQQTQRSITTLLKITLPPEYSKVKHLPHTRESQYKHKSPEPLKLNFSVCGWL